LRGGKVSKILPRREIDLLFTTRTRLSGGNLLFILKFWAALGLSFKGALSSAKVALKTKLNYLTKF
jgi:hypothetical protein